jgi:hypothetical protein
VKYLVLFCTLLLASFLAAQEQRGPDGRYHDPNTGEAQPEVCSNLASEPHPCECLHAKPMCDGTDSQEITGAKCKTYCRPKACRCETCCPEKKR